MTKLGELDILDVDIFVERMDKETIGISILKDTSKAFVPSIKGIFFIS